MSRAVSLALALTTSGVIMIAPFLVARHMDGTAHGWASLMMIGITGAFVHGIGFVPQKPWLRWIFSPAVAWPLIVAAGAALFFAR